MPRSATAFLSITFLLLALAATFFAQQQMAAFKDLQEARS
jgi:hypothetical protein